MLQIENKRGLSPPLLGWRHGIANVHIYTIPGIPSIGPTISLRSALPCHVIADGGPGAVVEAFSTHRCRPGQPPLFNL